MDPNLALAVYVLGPYSMGTVTVVVTYVQFLFTNVKSTYCLANLAWVRSIGNQFCVTFYKEKNENNLGLSTFIL